MKTGDYQTQDQAKEYHNKRFAKGLKYVHNDEAQIIGKWIEKYLPSCGKIYVDLGAGTGRVTRELLKHKVTKIYALDMSKAMLEELANSHKDDIKNNKINLINSFSHQTHLKSNCVNLVTSLHLFKHLENNDPTLIEVSRILRKDGFFIFDVLNKNSLIRLNLNGCSAITLLEIKKNLEKNGLIIKDVCYLNFLGESVYNLFDGIFAPLIHVFDNVIGKSFLGVGTKIFIVAQKK